MTPQDLRARWVAELRSGKHKQGKGCLTRVTPEGVEHCCLGVLCGPVLGMEGHGASGTLTYFGLVNGLYSTALPPGARKAVGIPSSSTGAFGVTYRNGCYASLADLNDSGFTFDQIADIIEYEPDGLFVEENA